MGAETDYGETSHPGGLDLRGLRGGFAYPRGAFAVRVAGDCGETFQPGDRDLRGLREGFAHPRGAATGSLALR